MRRLLLSLLIVVVAACSGPPDEDATGIEIYRQLCSSCHGVDLSGGVGPGLGSGSFSESMSDEVLTQVISRGRGSRMPAFSRTLSDAQMDRLVSYLREVQSG
jgi:mono/diheme cytochrome c family protein